MLDRLLDLLAGWLQALTPFVVVYAYERGVRLRWGRYHSDLEPGLHWLIPLADSVLTVNSVTNTFKLAPQNLTTRDQKDLAVTAIVTYRVTSPKTFLLEVEGGAEAVADVTFATVAGWVASQDYPTVTDPKNWPKLETKVRHAAKAYGIEVLRFGFADQCRAKALRLLSASN